MAHLAGAVARRVCSGDRPHGDHPDFVNLAYKTQGVELDWQGSGKDEKALCRKTGRTLVAVDEAFFRPSEVPALIGDATKAAQKLGWTPKIGLEEIIQEMVASDIHRAKAVPLLLKA